MVNLTFGEQVKIILSRKGMTIKQLAELMEAYTGKSMSRQNMTQRLHRDNFQEQDMRLIAKILGCQFQLSIMEVADETQVATAEPIKEEIVEEPVQEELHPHEREITVEELVAMTQEVEETIEEEKVIPNIASVQRRDEERELLRKGIKGYFKKSGSSSSENAGKKESEPATVVGDINPYTGKEYQSNSVRMHPKRIGYVQVYDREQHKWTDMTEWAFLGYQERKKHLLGKDYVPPIYLD